MNSISVVIVSFNAPFFLYICLESVSAALRGLEGEIIVVDNASTEACVSMVRESFPDVRVLANRENVGFSKAANQGAAAARGQQLLVLNPDVILPEDCLIKALDYASENPVMGAWDVVSSTGPGGFCRKAKEIFRESELPWQR